MAGSSGAMFDVDGSDELAEEGGDAATLLPPEFRDAIASRFGDERADAAVEKVEGDEGDDAPPAKVSEEVDGSSPLPSTSSDDDGDDAPTTPLFEIGDDEAAGIPTPEAPAPTPDLNDPTAIDLNDLFTQWNGGTKPDRAQITSLLSFVQQVATLPPAQAQALNEILNGGAPTPAPSPDVAATTPTPTSLLPDDLSPETRAILEPMAENQRALEARLAAYEAAQQQATVATQQQAFESGVRGASDQFVKDYSSILSPTDLILLETRTMQGGQFPLFLAQNNNDPAKAYRALLEYTAFSDDAIKAKIMGAQVQATATQAAADATRIRKASAVAAGGSAKAPTTKSAPAPQTRQERQAAAADFLRTQMAWDQ